MSQMRQCSFWQIDMPITIPDPLPECTFEVFPTSCPAAGRVSSEASPEGQLPSHPGAVL